MDSLPRDVFRMIVQNTDVGTLSRVAGVCRSLQAEAQHAFGRRTHHILFTCGVNPVRFFSKLRDTKAIIVGDIPLLITLPREFPPVSIIVIVPEMHFLDFCFAMDESFGFKLDRRIRRVWVFRRGGHVIFICASDSSAIANMGYAESTARMTFLSCYGLFIAYPKLTLKRRALRQTSIDRVWIERMAFMHPTGWIESQRTLEYWVEYDNHSCMTELSCPRSYRFLYDAGGLFFPLERVPGGGFIYTEQDSLVWALNSKTCRSRAPITAGFSIKKEVADVSPLLVSIQRYVQRLPGQQRSSGARRRNALMRALQMGTHFEYM